jgi:hypothetical protein
LACAAGVAVQEIIIRDGLLSRVRSNGHWLLKTLQSELQGIDSVGDIRGRGHFIGIEFVADRAAKTPFPAQHAISQRVGRAAMDRGLMIYPVGGNVDGVLGDGIILAPPYNATPAVLNELVDLTVQSIQDIF